MFVVVAGGEIRSRSLAQAQVLGQGGRLASSLALQQQQHGHPDATKYSGYSVSGAASVWFYVPTPREGWRCPPASWPPSPNPCLGNPSRAEGFPRGRNLPQLFASHEVGSGKEEADLKQREGPDTQP